MSARTDRIWARVVQFLRVAWPPLLSFTLWLGFAEVPCYLLTLVITAGGGNYDIRAIAQMACAALLMGVLLSAAVMLRGDMARWVRQNWPRMILPAAALIAGSFLAGRAATVSLLKLDANYGLSANLLVASALATVIYTPILTLGWSKPAALKWAVSQVSTVALRRETLWPFAGAVAGSVILLLSADAWRAIETVPAAVLLAFWILSVSVSVTLLVRGTNRVVRSRWIVTARLFTASLISFVAFYVAGANLVSPVVAAGWTESVRDPVRCEWWAAAECSLTYVAALGSMAVFLTSLLVTAVATSISVAEPQYASPAAESEARVK